MKQVIYSKILPIILIATLFIGGLCVNVPINAYAEEYNSLFIIDKEYIVDGQIIDNPNVRNMDGENYTLEDSEELMRKRAAALLVNDLELVNYYSQELECMGVSELTYDEVIELTGVLPHMENVPVTADYEYVNTGVYNTTYTSIYVDGDDKGIMRISFSPNKNSYLYYEDVATEWAREQNKIDWKQILKVTGEAVAGSTPIYGSYVSISTALASIWDTLSNVQDTSVEYDYEATQNMHYFYKWDDSTQGWVMFARTSFISYAVAYEFNTVVYDGTNSRPVKSTSPDYAADLYHEEYLDAKSLYLLSNGVGVNEDYVMEYLNIYGINSEYIPVINRRLNIPETPGICE